MERIGHVVVKIGENWKNSASICPSIMEAHRVDFGKTSRLNEEEDG